MADARPMPDKDPAMDDDQSVDMALIWEYIATYSRATQLEYPQRFLLTPLVAQLYSFTPGQGRTPLSSATDVLEVLDFNEEFKHTPAPYILVIKGEFGMGKSSVLAYSVAECLKQRGEPDIVPILPVVLSRRQFAEKSRRYNLDLQSLLSGIDDLKLTPGRLISLIRKGKVVLALDGLDEVISYDQIIGWATRLGQGLYDPTDAFARSKVIVTVRSELLRLAGLADFKQLANVFAFLDGRINAATIALHCLEIRGFGKNRLPVFFDKLSTPLPEEWSQLTLEEFRRPILAWIYCQLHKYETTVQELAQLLPARTNSLIDRYVKAACQASGHLDDPVRGYLNVHLEAEKARNGKVAFIWNREAIASVALNSYAATGGFDSSLGYEELKNIVPNEVVSFLLSKNETDEPSIRNYLLHKCPFFLRSPQFTGVSADATSAGDFYFVHRIFLEYFTALGVWDQEPYKEGEIPFDRFTAFDDLVLNVDMRKFLREMTAGERSGERNAQRWFERTRHAYALDLYLNGSPTPELHLAEKWELSSGSTPNREIARELDHNRCLILAMMTYPHLEEVRELAGELDVIDAMFPEFRPAEPVSQPIDRIRTAIDRFLNDTLRDNSNGVAWMHPRYLVPNLEPIAHYFFQYPDDRLRGHRFIRALQECFGCINSFLESRTPPGSSDSYAEGLLLERCLSIAQRLHLPLVQMWIDEHDLKKKISRLLAMEEHKPAHRNLLKRIKEICDDVPLKPKWPDPFC